MKLKKRGLLVFMAAMLLMTGVSRAADSFTVARVEVEEPGPGKIEHTVTGSGKVDNRRELAVYAAAGVLVAEVTAVQGQQVKKGEVLARLDMESLKEEIERLSGEIEIMRLQGAARAAAQQRQRQEQYRAKTRANEDYEAAVSENKRRIEESGEDVRAAREQVREAKKQVKKQEAQQYQSRQEELEAAVKAAQQAYEDAKEQEESAVLLARRAVEDAAKTPSAGYDKEIFLMQVNEKQYELNELYRKMVQGEDVTISQIRALENELWMLYLQQEEKENEEKKQEEERAQTLLRAQEDYERTAGKYAKLVREAKEKLDEANAALDEFLENGTVDFADVSVKTAQEALEEAKKALESARRQADDEKRLAKRGVEDASAGSAADNQEEIDRIQRRKSKERWQRFGPQRRTGET